MCECKLQGDLDNCNKLMVKELKLVYEDRPVTANFSKIN